RPQELRYYLGSAHYRSMLEYSETALQDAAAAYRKIEAFVRRVEDRVGPVDVGEWPAEFAAALDDDLGVPAALAVLHGTVTDGNRALESGDHDGAANAASSTRAMTGILGVDPLDPHWTASGATSDDAPAVAALDALITEQLELRTR